MDALEIVSVLRANGLEPTLIDIGMARADFRLGIKYKDPYDVFYAGKCLNNYNLGVIVDKTHLYFSNLMIDEKTFAEIVGGCGVGSVTYEENVKGKRLMGELTKEEDAPAYESIARDRT